MNEDKYPTQSVVLDVETKIQLRAMANADDRTESALIRTLIRQEFARRYSQPQPLITIEQAQSVIESPVGGDGNG